MDWAKGTGVVHHTLRVSWVEVLDQILAHLVRIEKGVSIVDSSSSPTINHNALLTPKDRGI